MRQKEFCARPLLHPWPWVHFKQIYLLPFRVPLSGSQPPGEVCVTSPPPHKWDLPETTSSRRNMFLSLLEDKTKTKIKKTKRQAQAVSPVIGRRSSEQNYGMPIPATSN